MGEYLHRAYDGRANPNSEFPSHTMRFAEAHSGRALSLKLSSNHQHAAAMISKEDALDLARVIIDRWGEKPAAEPSVPQAEINRRRGSAWARMGGKPAAQWSECPACDGAGSLWFSPTREVRTMADPRPIMDDCELIACPWCEGEGKVPVVTP